MRTIPDVPMRLVDRRCHGSVANGQMVCLHLGGSQGESCIRLASGEQNACEDVTFYAQRAGADVANRAILTARVRLRSPEA